MDLPADVAEQPLDRGVHVLVRLEHGVRLVRDRGQPLLHLVQLVRGEEPRAVEAGRVLRGRRAVVGEQLEVVGAEELPYGGIELALRAA
jgi:hypothetical protein